MWTQIAEAEWKLKSFEKKRINMSLHQHLPNISVKSIRRVRNKQQYRTFYNDFILERTTESGNQTKTLKYPIPDLQGTDDVENGRCLKQFVIGNYQLLNLSAEELSQLLNQSTQSETKQNLIDREYLMWVGGLMTRSKERNARPTRGRKKKKLIRQETTNVVNREEINNQGNNRKFLVARTRPTKREVRIKERQKQRNFKL